MHVSPAMTALYKRVTPLGWLAQSRADLPVKANVSVSPTERRTLVNSASSSTPGTAVRQLTTGHPFQARPGNLWVTASFNESVP